MTLFSPIKAATFRLLVASLLVTTSSFSMAANDNVKVTSAVTQKDLNQTEKSIASEPNNLEAMPQQYFVAQAPAAEAPLKKPESRLSKDDQKSVAEDTKTLLATRGGVKLGISYCAITSTEARDVTGGEGCKQYLQKSASKHWQSDFADMMLALQGKKASVADAEALIADLANKVRNPKAVARDGHYYMDCDNANAAQCTYTQPITEDEMVRASDRNPTPEMNASRAVRLTTSTAAVIGYLSASLQPEAYVWKNPDGTPMSIEQTVKAQSAETPAQTIDTVFLSCFMYPDDPDLPNCAKAGVRSALRDYVKNRFSSTSAKP